MRRLGYFLVGSAVLLVLAAFVLLVLAIWSDGRAAERLGQTGSLAVILALPVFGGGCIALSEAS